ncbi:MAG: tetratricopeptide repeat protein [Myxococcota bacterium]|jgi:tetratricopeptide (TPR) repeat protein|nr:tetratricopeptide repeat protein [Myxococcota bacterium]
MQRSTRTTTTAHSGQGAFADAPVRVPRNASSPLALALLVLLSIFFLAGCYNDPESRLAEIRAIQAGGRFEESIKPLRVLLTAEPDHPEANYRLGVALVQTGRSSLALWPLMKGANSEEFGTQAGMLLTATLISQESYEEAIRAIDRIIEREPDNLPARYARATAYIGAARPADALSDADHVLSVKPGDGHAYSIKMAALLDLKRFDEAEASQLELVKITEAGTSIDQAARACGILARFYADQGDNDKSQETHEVCLEKYPDHPMVRSWASSFYTLTGQPDKSIAIWRGAIDANPEDFDLRTTLANLLAEQDRMEEAEELMVQTAELFDSARAYQALSHLYSRNDKPTKAREALETALARTKNEPDVLRYTVGDLFIEEGDLESASEVAKGLKEPSYRHLLNGAIQLAKGDPVKALQDFDRGLRLWPNNARARFLAGVAAQRAGMHDRAITEFRESVRVSETETDASLQLARIYYTLGQWTTARQFASRHVKNRPLVSPEGHIIDARAAAAQNQLAAAYRTLDSLKQTIFAGAAMAERASLMAEYETLAKAIEYVEGASLDLTHIDQLPVVRVYSALLLDAGRGDDASRTASKLQAQNPESLEAMEVAAAVFDRLGTHAEAEALVDDAIAQNADFAPGLALKASLVARRGEDTTALELFDRAAAADHQNPNYAYQASRIVRKRGDTTGANERLRAIVKSEPGHVPANNDLAWHLAQADEELDFALEMATRASARQPDADTLDTLGWVQYKRGTYDEAIATFEKALELRPDSASIRYRLGLALAKAGSDKQARAALEQAIGGSAFPELDDAKAELARLQGS